MTIPISDRTFQFAVRIVKLCTHLSERPGVPRVLANQLLRSGTSIGANTAEAQSGQSCKDFLHKLEIALKEARETEYWLKLLIASDVLPQQRLAELIQEIDEIIKILVAITRKVKQNPTKDPQNFGKH
ncbi:MAG: four helix bundle protein [Cyanobacteria bacterium P01_D01_bin.6]